MMRSHQAATQQTIAMSTAFFLDDLGDFAQIPATAVVIGEASNNQRKTWTAEGRVVGMSAALNQEKANGFNLWSLVQPHLAGAGDKPDQAAAAILNAVLTYGFGTSKSEFPLATEGTKTPQGGYTFWAQDFEYTPGAGVSANEVYAAITAVLWAGRQVLDTAMLILPVPSSSLFKTLGDPDFDTIFESNSYLAELKLNNLPTPNPAPGSNGQWNALEVWHRNDLIDGFLGQQYSSNNPDALPGHLSKDTRAFPPDSTIPFAILSKKEQLVNTDLADFPKPWRSVYNDSANNLPFTDGIYFDGQSSPRGFDPADYLTPTPGSVVSTTIAGLQVQNDQPLLDLRDFSFRDTLTAELNVYRSADDQVIAGFHRVLDTDGSVLDPVSGSILKPDDQGYAQAALVSGNRVIELQGLQTDDESLTSRSTEITGGFILAPFVITPDGRTYFAWSEANEDGAVHFRSNGLNSIGVEDQEDGGDQDFNDLTLSFLWDVA